MTAKEAYKDLMKEIFRNDENPTYALAAMTLVNRYGARTVSEMEEQGLIKYIGQNHNNMAVYRIR